MVLNTEPLCRLTFVPAEGQGVLVLLAYIGEQHLLDKVRSEFSANAAAALKAPLDCLSGFAEMIQSGILSAEDTAHFAQKINDEAKGMTHLIESLMFLSKLDEQNVRFAVFDVARVAAEAMDKLRPLAAAREVEMILLDSPCPIYGNRVLIHEMFVNLIQNAIQYTQAQGQVKVAVSARNQMAYAYVSDTGIGIASGDLGRVFERFYKGETKTKRRKQVAFNDLEDVENEALGVGLGLSIVRSIVRHHKGTIELESAEGKGTRVYVKLPQRKE